jgi:hypothetical protein
MTKPRQLYYVNLIVLEIKTNKQMIGVDSSSCDLFNTKFMNAISTTVANKQTHITPHSHPAWKWALPQFHSLLLINSFVH